MILELFVTGNDVVAVQKQPVVLSAWPFPKGLKNGLVPMQSLYIVVSRQFQCR